MIHIQKRYSLDTIQAAAEWLLQQMQNHKVIALSGQMGAGKTTLVNAICTILGTTDTVSSPTFSIINEYHLAHNGKEERMYHIDLYRLNSEQEATQAGVEDCIYSGHYCLIEWPEKAPHLFPAETLYVQLKHDSEKTRIIEIVRNS